MNYETLKLHKDYYSFDGKTFTDMLEAVDPTNSYDTNTRVLGLDAFERQLYRFDVKVSGDNADRVNKFYDNAQSAILLPEYIRRSVTNGIKGGNILNSIAFIEYWNKSDNPQIMAIKQDKNSDRITLIDHISDEDFHFNYSLTYYTLLGNQGISAENNRIPNLSLNTFGNILKKAGRNIRNELLRRLMNFILDSFKNEINNITTNERYKFDNGKTIICNSYTFDKVFKGNILDSYTLIYDYEGHSIQTKLGTDIEIIDSLPNDIIINLDKNLAIQLIATNIKIEDIDSIINNDFNAIYCSWVVDGCIFDRSSIKVYKVSEEKNLVINGIDPYFTIPTPQYNRDKSNDLIIKIDCANTSNSITGTTNTIYTEMNKEDTKVSKYFSEGETGKWKINADGYYPYCPNCNYEPIYEGWGKLPKNCPKCNMDMRDIDEKISYYWSRYVRKGPNIYFCPDCKASVESEYENSLPRYCLNCKQDMKIEPSKIGC